MKGKMTELGPATQQFIKDIEKYNPTLAMTVQLVCEISYLEGKKSERENFNKFIADMYDSNGVIL